MLIFDKSKKDKDIKIEFYHHYFLPISLSDIDLNEIEKYLIEKSEENNARFTAKCTSIENNLLAVINFDWNTTTKDYGTEGPYATLVKERLYKKVHQGTLTIHQKGCILWKIEVPIEFDRTLTDWHRNLIFTMMHKPLYNIEILDKIEEILFNKSGNIFYPKLRKFTREFWPMDKYCQQKTAKEDKDILETGTIKALRSWITNSTILLNSEDLIRFDELSTGIAFLKIYRCRISESLDIEENSIARQIYHEFKYRENLLDAAEKLYNMMKIREWIENRDVIQEI